MKTNNKTWKPVTISGFTGILMGAGAMHKAQSYASATGVDVDDSQPESQSLDELSFREAFDSARAEMGPGGVFSWRGNLYNTYTADEWQAMSEAEKDQFAEDVAPEVSPADIDTDNLAESSATDEENNAEPDAASANEVTTQKPAMSVASEQVPEDSDDDVRVLGFGDVQLADGRTVTVEELDMNGQRVAVIDLDQDGTPDIAMSDLNHNQQIDEGEVIDLHTGEPLSFTNDDVAQDDMPIDTFDA